MITVTARQLESNGFSSTSFLAAVQTARELVQNSGDGVKLIAKLLGGDPPQLGEPPIRDPIEWEVMVAQGVVDQLVRSVDTPVDPDVVIATSLARCHRLAASPAHRWMYPKTEEGEAAQAKPTGSRQERAAALYKKHVIDAEVKPTNMWFKELLVKELGMTASGASTYAFDCDKDHRLLVKRQR